MTERRSHWSDDLIDAVKDAISRWCFDHVEGPLYDEDVYPAIAAVEDWARWEHVPKGTLLRLEQAEAAIQRVRNALERYAVVPYSEMSQTDALAAVRDALDGE